MRIQLSAEDREKYGAPEWIEFEYGRWGLKLVDAMEQQVGWAVEDLRNNLFRKVTVDKLDDDGDPVLDEAGQPVKEESVDPRPLALAVLAWLGLRSLPGNRTTWDEFDVTAVGLTIDWSSGKAETAEEDSDPPSD